MNKEFTTFSNISELWRKKTKPSCFCCRTIFSLEITLNKIKMTVLWKIWLRIGFWKGNNAERAADSRLIRVPIFSVMFGFLSPRFCRKRQKQAPLCLQFWLLLWITVKAQLRLNFSSSSLWPLCRQRLSFRPPILPWFQPPTWPQLSPLWPATKPQWF